MSRRTSIKLFHESGPAQLEGYIEYGLLIAAVIRCGLKDDGLDYLQTAGGQYWCLLGNVDPEVDATNEAGMLLENLPKLWKVADMNERRRILLNMLEAVYVDTVEEKAIVALRPKPAFQALFQIATTREGSNVILYKENPPDQFPSPEDDSPCFWWRRGRVERYRTPYLRNPVSATGLVGVELLAA